MLYWEWYPYNEYQELMEAGLIPDESDEEMTGRVQDDVTETKREANVGDAWASLEHNVLTNELTESE